VTGRVIERLSARNEGLRGKLGLVKFRVRERLIAFIESQTDAQTRAAFESLFTAARLGFYLECMEGRFEIPPEVQVRVTRRMVHDDNSPIQRSLFDLVPDEMNDYEKSVALFLDRHPQVLWWYRNLVGSQHFAIQGYRRNRIYPDFVVQQGEDATPTATVIVVESKGQHLEGNPDTKYKRSIADYFEKVGKKIPWQKLGRDFKDEQFRFQVLDEGDAKAKDWQDTLHQVLANYRV
jgi:type III restriction enzyme